MTWRPYFAEALGTALLVFFAVGTAALTFGFHVAGTSTSAGVVATALAFGLVLGALVYAIGPVSGCHINPAVTIGFLVSRRITVQTAVFYWLAQFAGGIIGAGVLYGLFNTVPSYHSSLQGLGTDGYGSHSIIGISAGGAFLAEVVLTFLFVLVILAVTRKSDNAVVAGLVIGLTLTLVHIIGIPIDGTSVNPARSLGPALFVGSSALDQVWVFIVAPLVGGSLSALAFAALYPDREAEGSVEPAEELGAP